MLLRHILLELTSSTCTVQDIIGPLALSSARVFFLSVLVSAASAPRVHFMSSLCPSTVEQNTGTGWLPQTLCTNEYHKRRTKDLAAVSRYWMLSTTPTTPTFRGLGRHLVQGNAISAASPLWTIKRLNYKAAWKASGPACFSTTEMRGRFQSLDVGRVLGSLQGVLFIQLVPSHPIQIKSK